MNIGVCCKIRKMNKERTSSLPSAALRAAFGSCALYTRLRAGVCKGRWHAEGVTEGLSALFWCPTIPRSWLCHASPLYTRGPWGAFRFTQLFKITILQQTLCCLCLGDFFDLDDHIADHGGDILSEHPCKQPVQVFIKMLRQNGAFCGTDALHSFFSGVGHLI